jgi:hypothetical protein
MATTKATKAKTTTRAKRSPKKSTKTTATKRAANSRYWFAAKRYGYGWSRPLTWQGWVVMLGFIASFVWFGVWASNRVAAGQTFGWSDEKFVVTGFFLMMAVALPVLTAVCALTGEPARWRWGTTRPDKRK